MVWPGRAARLRLQGNAGNIDLWVLYFHTGSQVSDADRMHVLPYASEQCHTFEGLREHMRNRIGRAMADSRTTLSFVAGDFNWAAQDDDRRSAGSLEHSGHRDHAEERHWDSTVLARREMYEFHQAEYTHRSASAWSRLDRFYGNLAVTDQLDRRISVSALEWKRSLSHHRAIGFSKQTPVRDNSSGVSITAIHHKDFPRRVRLEFQSLVQQEDKDKVGFSGAEKSSDKRRPEIGFSGSTAVASSSDSDPNPKSSIPSSPLSMSNWALLTCLLAFVLASMVSCWRSSQTMCAAAGNSLHGILFLPFS